MSPQALPRPLPELIPEQEVLYGFVSTVMGPIDHRVWKKQMERMDEILNLSGAEKHFQRLSLAQRNKEEEAAAAKENRPFRALSPAEQLSYQRLCSQALRCTLVRTLLGEDLRGCSRYLTESAFLQWFCRLDQVEEIRIPGKSALQRYGTWLPEEEMREVIGTLLSAASEQSGDSKQSLKLAEPLDLESYFLDTTCVKLNIHFPVDWVLLRDAARTLMKATMLIRKRGLKARMEEPEVFLKRMNQLCMKMTHTRRKKDAKRARKAVLREMKKLSTIVAKHGQRHQQLLEQHWQETDLKEGEAQQIIGRIGVVLERLPEAIRQAHERIIGERLVPSKEKILSLYEEHAGVYVRGKAGAEVEFGSQLLLGECASGVIVDWELVGGNPMADTKMLKRSLERMRGTAAGSKISEVCGDRGFDSKANRDLLEERKIYNAICPKAPVDLKKRIKEERFAQLQRRRSQTEARIAVFKNGFLGSPLMSKGHENQAIEVAWNVMAHNLWVIARQPVAKTALKSKDRKLAKTG
jgi:hypothetical protein